MISKRLFTLLLPSIIITHSLAAQDTLHHTSLPDITIVGHGSRSDYQQMPEIVGTSIYAGKKSTLIVMDNVQGNTATNTMRQILAKVPGIHVWESDPSGIQIGIAARGLSPNRSWEFNTRQNGYDISADPFGYPEAYYNPPMQAVQRIEVVRGQGALQYGPQFGGMVNYILRNGSDIKKPLEWETQQTVGSNALFNTFNAIGGKKGKWHYYGFYDHRQGNGWRAHSRYYTNAGFATTTYHFNDKTALTAEVMHSHIRSQQPGGLTDSMLYASPQSSLRSRNWFDIQWTNPALILRSQITPNLLFTTRLFATIGNRNSVGFLQSITTKDSINKSTLTYNPRTVNLDEYRNYGLESRALLHYALGKMNNTLSGGIRLYTGTTYRRADGKGTTGVDYDVAVQDNYPRDVHFASQNAAAFAENIFRITDKLLVIPGVRFEWLQGSASGRNGYNTKGDEVLLQNISRSRSFVLGGLGLEYHIAPGAALYGNFAQAYRPIQFANLQAPPTTDVVDQDLKDAKGYNADIGFRGKMNDVLQWDASVFYLQYNNRVGIVSLPSYRLITNVGSSSSMGFEGYGEWNALRTFTQHHNADLLIFASYSYTDARYGSDIKDTAMRSKKVENAPAHILRTGLTGGYHNALLTLQYSYVSATFSDANNTEKPTANGNTGLIPAYSIIDLTASYEYKKRITLKAGINNLMNTTYFTRRAGGYPGPGALPADGRTYFVSVGARL